MAHPLDGAYVKLARADEHLKVFDVGVAAFIRDRPYELAWDVDKATSENVLWFEPTREPPLELAALIGEIVFSLRSALDHAAYQMSLLKGRHSKSTAFPICLTEVDFTTGYGKKMMQQILLPDARALIEEVQPFKRPGLEHQVPFAVLSELCNVDKHRLLHLTRPYASALGVDGIADGVAGIRVGFGPFTRKAVLIRMPASIPPSVVKVDIESYLTLAFTEAHIPRFADSAHKVLNMSRGAVAGWLHSTMSKGVFPRR